MAKLFDAIREAVREDRVIIGLHADDRLRERCIMGWQIIEGLQQGRLVNVRPDDQPNPIIEVEQVLANGEKVKAVWAWLAYNRVAKLVTVHLVEQS